MKLCYNYDVCQNVNATNLHVTRLPDLGKIVVYYCDACYHDAMEEGGEMALFEKRMLDIDAREEARALRDKATYLPGCHRECSTCIHAGAETSNDVAFCNCCEDHEYWAPETK